MVYTKIYESANNYQRAFLEHPGYFNPYIFVGSLETAYDGDSPTITLNRAFLEQRLHKKTRLFGIDAFEKRGWERPLGLKARDLLLDLIPPGEPFLVQTHKDESGMYGRLLITPWVIHGAGQLMVRPLNVCKVLFDEKLAVPYFAEDGSELSAKERRRLKADLAADVWGLSAD